MNDAQLIKWAFEQRKENPDLFQGSAGVIVLKHTSGFKDGNITIRRGDILLNLNGEAIQSTKHYRRLLITIIESNTNKLLFFLRNKIQYKITLNPGTHRISVINISLRPPMVYLEKVGNQAYKAGSTDKALEQWLLAFDLANLLEDEKSLNKFAHNIGAIYQAKEMYKEALPYLLRCLKYAESTGDLKDQEDYFGSVGVSYLKLGKSHAALPYLQQALVRATANGNKRKQAKHHGNLGAAYNGLSQYKKALKHLHQSLTLHNDFNDLEVKSQALLEIAATYSALGQHEEALHNYNIVLSISNDTKHDKLKIRVLSNIANVYSRNEQFDKALQTYQQSLLLTRRSVDKEVLATIYTNMGTLYRTIGEYEKALQQHNKALIIYQEIEKPYLEANILNNIGIVYDDFGQDVIARSYFKKSLTIFRMLGDKHSEGMSYTNIAGTYRSLDNAKQALLFYTKALNMFQTMQDRRLEGVALGNIGLVYRDMGDYKKALSYYQQSLAISEIFNHRLDEALDNLRIGEIYNYLGKQQEALPFIYKSLSINLEFGLQSRLYADYGSLHWSLRGLGQNQSAILFGKLAVNAIQSMRTNIKNLDKSIKKNFLKNKESYYQSLISLLLEENRILEAQKVIDMLKEDEFLDFLRSAKHRNTNITPIQCNKDEQIWCQRFTEISNNLLTISKSIKLLESKKTTMVLDEQEEQTYRQLKEDSKIGKKAFAAFFKRLKLDFKTSEVGESRHDEFTHKRIEDYPSMQGVLRELGHGAVVVYYVVDNDKLHIILITQDNNIAKTVAVSEYELNKQIIAFRNVLKHPKKDTNLLGKVLYDLLFKPIAQELRTAEARTLMLSLHGSLRYLPIAALYDGEHYVVEKYALAVYTPGNASSFFSLKDKPKEHWKAVGLGLSALDNCWVSAPLLDQVPVLSNLPDRAKICFPNLPSVPAELDGIIRREDSLDEDGVIPGIFHLNKGFTKQTFDDALVRKYPVLHIASHFQLESTNIENSYLVLGDGKPLSLRQIAEGELDFNGIELLTLSACDTAVGRSGANGREVEGFGALAQSMGAKGVLATLWSVLDISTSIFMQHVYSFREVGAGLTKAEAVRQAQLMLLRGKSSINASDQSRHLLGPVSSENQQTKTSDKFEANTVTKYSHPFYWAPFILIGNWL